LPESIKKELKINHQELKELGKSTSRETELHVFTQLDFPTQEKQLGLNSLEKQEIKQPGKFDLDKRLLLFLIFVVMTVFGLYLISDANESDLIVLTIISISIVIYLKYYGEEASSTSTKI